MFHLNFSIQCLYVLARFLLPLPWRRRSKVAMGALLLVGSQYHLWNRLSSGSVFAPEFSQSLVLAFNWAFGAILFLALLQIALDLVAAQGSRSGGRDRSRRLVCAPAPP